jgi:hypothetical protein
VVSGYTDSRKSQEIFWKNMPNYVTGVYNTNVNAPHINLGDTFGFTLSGTVDILVNGSKPSAIIITAFTDPDNPYGSILGDAYIYDYNTKPNTWTMYAEMPPSGAGTTVYFRFRYGVDDNSPWYTLPLTGTCTAPTFGGSVPGIPLSYSGNGIPAPRIHSINTGGPNPILFCENIEGVSSYKVYRSTSADTGYSHIGTVPAGNPIGTFQYTDSTATGPGVYYYKVSAVISGNEGALSTYFPAVLGGVLNLSNFSSYFRVFVTTTTLGVGSTENTITASGSLNANGTSNSNGGFSNLHWYSGNGSGYYNVLVVSGSATKYQNNVSFLNGAGSLDWNSMSTAGPGTISAPTGLTVTGSNSSSVSLSWNPVSEATFYNVYRSTDGGSLYTHRSITSSSSYIDTGLSSGTPYHYTVTASAAGYESAQSNTVSTTTTP